MLQGFLDGCQAVPNWLLEVSGWLTDTCEGVLAGCYAVACQLLCYKVLYL